jgi:tetratricopeptide (TPR) repeat protein
MSCAGWAGYLGAAFLQISRVSGQAQDLVPEAADLARQGTLLERAGKLAEAEDAYRRGLLLYEKALGPDHSIVAAGLEAVARLYIKERRYAKAEPIAKRAIAIKETSFNPESPQIAPRARESRRRVPEHTAL